MLIHSYLTNGFVKMAEVFLKSLKQITYPQCPHVCLETRNLSYDDFIVLRSSYPDVYLEIHNKKIDMEAWAKRAEISVKKLEAYKQQCEQRYVSQRNKVWKLMVAAEDRPRALCERLFEPDRTIDFIAHFDIDTLFRLPIDVIPRMMEDTDIWLKLRPKHNVVKARITIDCILVKPTEMVKLFFDRWFHYLDIVPPRKRPIGYGQTSCWLAFEEVKDKLNYKKLPLIFGLPGRNKKDQIVWTGNIHRMGKDDCVEMFKKEANL